MYHDPDSLWSALPDPDTRPEFYADVPTKRFIAWIVDAVLILLLTLIVLPLTGFTGIFFFPFLYQMVSFAYRTVTIARSSATPGMRLTAIELRTFRGERLDTGLAAFHSGLFILSTSFVLPQIISVVLMLTGPRAQGLSDHMLGTAALNRMARV